MPLGRKEQAEQIIPKLREVEVEAGRVRWTPDFGRPDKVKPPGWEAPYQEDDDVGKATRVWGSV